MTKHWVHKYNLLMYDHVDSTNAAALRLVQNGVKGNYIIFSKQQTEGKSRYGSEWFSPKGNFFLSLLLEPTFTIQSGAELSFVTSLAIRDALISVLGLNYLDINFKWPNTILLNGKKIGAVLLESSSTPQKNIPNWFIIGIGINLIHYQEGGDFPSTSLKNEGFGDLHFKVDPATGLEAIIAIHSTKRGPALGGCRFIHYDSSEDAIIDAMRLALAA